MTITQTVDIPADHRVFFEFLAPREIPAGKTRVEVKLTPVVEKQDTALSAEGRATPHKETLAEILSQPTPRADALSGILSGLGDITLEQIREERLAKYLE